MNHTATQMTQPLIRPYPPQGEEARVEDALQTIKEHVGFIPDGLKLYSLSPPLLDAFLANVSYFNSGRTLEPALTTMIRYLVSSAANCQFCIDMNEGFLLNMGYEQDAIRAARNNPDTAPLPERDKALLKYALKSVETPHTITEADIEQLRELGWSERAMFDATVQANNNRAFNNVLRTFNIEQQGVFA